MCVTRTIQAYYGLIADGTPWRYRSWEHCYSFFRKHGRDGIIVSRDEAALQLAFYLASWGMYRGSSFLLKYDYTIHLPAIERLSNEHFAPLWQHEIGSSETDADLVPLILDAASNVHAAYRRWHEPTEILVTKILLGTLGCLPACDRFFVDGFRSSGLRYSCFNSEFVKRAIKFCREHENVLRTEQSRIEQMSGVRYPLMKLVDMHFHQIGYERSGQ